jgi:DNA topoisomerase-3
VGSIQNKKLSRKKEVTELRLKFVHVKKGTLIKGKSAGCSNYKAGCDFVLPYTYAEKKYQRTNTYDYSKGSTVNLKRL